MQILDPEIKQSINSLIDKAMNNFNPQNIETTISTLKEAWDLLPNKKEDWEESFLISKYITHVYYNAKHIENAFKWAKIFNNSFVQRNYGESEFMLGKILFDMGKSDESKEWFLKADKLSEGRVWKGEKDVKFFKFFKSK